MEEKPKSGIMEKLKQVRESSKKRKFAQTWDLTVSLKNIDLKKPENRFSHELVLPGGKGKKNKVVVIADSLVKEAEGVADLVIKKDDIPEIAKNKKTIKKLANDYDWFFGEVTVMTLIGKSFGVVLGPRGKVPKPIPPKIKLEPFIERAKNLTRVSLKTSPVIHVVVGTEAMEDEKIAKNIEAVMNLVKEKLPKGINSIKSAQIKLTMSKPVKLEVI